MRVTGFGPCPATRICTEVHTRRNVTILHVSKGKKKRRGEGEEGRTQEKDSLTGDLAPLLALRLYWVLYFHPPPPPPQGPQSDKLTTSREQRRLEGSNVVSSIASVFLNVPALMPLVQFDATWADNSSLPMNWEYCRLGPKSAHKPPPTETLFGPAHLKVQRLPDKDLLLVGPTTPNLYKTIVLRSPGARQILQKKGDISTSLQLDHSRPSLREDMGQSTHKR